MIKSQKPLCDALGLTADHGLLSIVGGGGKSSLMFALGNLLPGRVLLTTTTRIFSAQMDIAERVFTLDDPKWREEIASIAGPSLLVGHVEGEKAVGVPPELPGELLKNGQTDWIVLEADGSRMRPTKAPAEHEPVIPHDSSQVVITVGIDALSGPIRQQTHRPERVSAVTGLSEDATLTPGSLARLMTSAQGGLKGIPEQATVSLLINKVESDVTQQYAEEIALLALKHSRIRRVIAGKMKPTANSPWTVWSR